MPRVIGGRYGLSSKEFTPGDGQGGLRRARAAERPQHHFTVGIDDDVTHTSLPYDADVRHRAGRRRCARCSTASAPTARSAPTRTRSRSSARRPTCYAQGYFVYDSKKSGSHDRLAPALRAAADPLALPDRAGRASSPATSSSFLERIDVLGRGRARRDVPAERPYAPDEVWDAAAARRCRQQIIDKQHRASTSIDADRGRRARPGMGGRINTIMQTCFFALSGVLPARRGDRRRSRRRSRRPTASAAPRSCAQRTSPRSTARWRACTRSRCPAPVTGDARPPPPVPADAPEFVQRVTAEMMAGRGDELPVSALPVDGTYPDAARRAYEKRNIADEIPVWDPTLCIQCGKCALVCPHAAIRVQGLRRRPRSPARRTAFQSAPLDGARPAGTPRTRSRSRRGLHRLRAVRRGLPGQGTRATPGTRRSTWRRSRRIRDAERANCDFFRDLPVDDRVAGRLRHGQAASQFLEPLFEFSGACAGCGETPYIKLLTPALRRPRCWSPTRPAARRSTAATCRRRRGRRTPTGRGPAWANSLFEDNAEFGLGMRLARRPAHARWRAQLLERAARRRSATSSSTRSARRRPVRRGRASRRSASGWPSCAQRLGGARRRRRAPTCERSPTTWSRRACGSSAATAGPTTSASAASTTCWPAGATSTSWCSTPRSTRTPAARRRRRRRAARWPSSPPAGKTDAEEGPRPAWRWPTATSTSRRSRWAPTTQQTLKAFLEAEAYAGPVADHRLQPLHRPRHRHAQRARPAEAGRRQRATGRSTATTRRCARRAATRSSSTRRGRASRSRTTSTSELRYRSLRNSDPAEAERLLGAGRGRRSTSAGRSTRRWPPAVAQHFPPDARRRALMDLSTGVRTVSLDPRTPTSARSGSPLVASPSSADGSWTASGALADAGVGRWCCPRCSRSSSTPRSCARLRGSPSRPRTLTPRRSRYFPA